MQATDSASAEQLAIERGALLSCEMWQVPRVLWTQWCTVLIDTWTSFLPAPTAFGTYRDADAMPSTALPADEEGRS